VVEELQADAAIEAGFGSGADTCAAGPHGAVAVFTSAGGGAEDVEEGVDGFFALVPEKFAGFLSAEEGGVFLDCNILEAGILGFGECGEVFVEFRKSIVSLAVGFWELNLGARD